MIGWRASRVLAAAVVLAGCPRRVPAEPPSVVVVHDPPAAPTGSPLVGALDGVGMTLLLPRERQVEEVVALQESLGRTDLATDRLQLALLLTLGDEPVRDAARARELLAGRSWTDASSETLARLVLELIDEREARGEEHAQATLALAEERRLRRDLEERIEAMKAIDTEIDARELGAEATDDGPAEDPVR